ncbi:MAG: hypothetical protein HXX18_07660 [Bacteroidetes bacterium]|nr:hypothetical protein [Bacteroidota bacterium]
MKTKFKFLATILLLVAMTSINAQDSLSKDPLLQFKSFFEVALAVNQTRVNTNYTTFITKNGIYNFEKGSLTPTIDGFINYGWIFKSNTNEIYTLKTGLNVISRSAKLTDSIGTNLMYSEGLFQIPIQFGIRLPKRFNTIKNNLYRAFDLNIGFYIAIPYIEILDQKNNLDANGVSSFGNYCRYGFVSEISYSALNTKGYGHKIGLRASIDLKSITKFKETKYELYPYYSTIGIFYNFLNKYNK